jgi:XTP/dITP diphosphohydrolase
MKLVLASNNAKKLKELRALFGDLAIELQPQGELGIGEADEPHITFVENALAKARHAAAACRGAAMADDSGLCVDALGGDPGVQSAVFAPMPEVSSADRELRRQAQDRANNDKLLAAMTEVTDRQAAFVSTLVAIRHAEDPEPLIAFGRWPGTILRASDGEGGFGYDPLVFIPELGRSVARLQAAVKNGCSHRARAAAQMRQLLNLHWRL